MPRNAEYRYKEERTRNAGNIFFIILATVFVIAAAVFAFKYFGSQTEKNNLSDQYDAAQQELAEAKKEKAANQEKFDGLAAEADELQKAIDALSAQ